MRIQDILCSSLLFILVSFELLWELTIVVPLVLVVMQENIHIFICFSLKKRCRKFDRFSLSFEEVMGFQSFQDFDVDDVTNGLSYHTRYLHKR